MKKLFAKILLCSMILSCMLVLPANAVQAGDNGQSSGIMPRDTVYIEEAWARITIKGNGGSGSSVVCKKTLSGSGVKLSNFSLTSNNDKEVMKGSLGCCRIDLGSGVDVISPISVRVGQSSDGTYGYLPGKGQIDKVYYMTLKSTNSSSVYSMSLTTLFQP